jgi:hypothetical protein
MPIRAPRPIRDNGLSLAMFGLFALFLVGHAATGWHQHNEEQRQKGEAPSAFGQYLRSGDFLESVAENWESEFLQMAGFLFLSAWLYQRGAAESRDPDAVEEDADPIANRRPDSPWPVHRGGLALALYSRSLSIALGLLFVISFLGHAVAGSMRFNQDAAKHGLPAIHFWQYIGSSSFWFESFQIWQSEFLSVGVLIVLSIFLRQKGSPESKPVHAPHPQTGTS